jgi:hypothetical protein
MKSREKIVEGETGKDLNCRSFNQRSYFANLFILFLFMLALISNVSAIGVTPARTTLDFAPNLEKEVSFSVINSEHKDMSVIIFVKGDLNSSVTLKQTYADFAASEESKQFSYSVKLPEKIELPGRHEAEIVVLQMPKDLKAGAAVVGATVAVVTQLYVNVPYPGKYLESSLAVVEAEGEARFIVPVINRGKLDIVSAKATIDVYSAANEKIATIDSDEKEVKSAERKELYASYNGLNPGKYRAVATITYDGETTSTEQIFSIGEKKLEIETIEVRGFSLGEIAKFNILVNNKWGEEFKEVYVEMLVYNNEGQTMADVKSASYDVPALSKKEIVSYWDTAGVKVGKYPGKLIIKYGDKQDERNIDVNVDINNIEITGATGLAVFPEKAGANLQTILIIGVIVLVIINGIWFYLYFKKKKKA